MVIGLSGTFFACIASEEYFNPNRNKGFNEEDEVVTGLRCIVTLTTLILLVLVYRHYKLDLQF